jgi:pimeloyl-ACP methyl ester carboxylesterase
MNWPVEFIRVAANGINFEIATMGSGERLALCLHGFPEHAYSWRNQMPLLARLGYRVWAPNLRGYGATDSPSEVSAYQPRTLVEDIASLIRAANAKETLVVAHDLGAVLAWLLAMDQPQIINRLIILNLPHPACFAREVRKPTQLAKSWYTLFFQLPWLPEKILGRCHGRGAAELIRNTSCKPALFTDEILEIYRFNAARPGGLSRYAQLVSWIFSQWRIETFFWPPHSGHPHSHALSLGRLRCRAQPAHHARHREIRFRSHLPRSSRRLTLDPTGSAGGGKRHA